MRYAFAALVVSLLAMPVMAMEPLGSAEMDKVTAGYTRPVSVLASVPGVVSQVTSDTSIVSGVAASSSASVVAE